LRRWSARTSDRPREQWAHGILHRVLYVLMDRPPFLRVHENMLRLESPL
jgi:hypothetical protein